MKQLTPPLTHKECRWHLTWQTFILYTCACKSIHITVTKWLLVAGKDMMISGDPSFFHDQPVTCWHLSCFLYIIEEYFVNSLKHTIKSPKVLNLNRFFFFSTSTGSYVTSNWFSSFIDSHSQKGWFCGECHLTININGVGSNKLIPENDFAKFHIPLPHTPPPSLEFGTNDWFMKFQRSPKHTLLY